MIAINAYLDNASTTRVRPEVVKIMVDVMSTEYGNPSSTHEMGRRALAALDSAREKVAGALGASPEEIFFTSGGTEADNWAILGAAQRLSRRGSHMITSLIEHDAVRRPVSVLKSRGWEITYLRPDKDGRISAESFAEALREDTLFASIMLVNNETGAVSPVWEMTREIKRRGLPTLFHTDAVQGFGKIPFTASSLGADMITLSAHKIHGPKGAGALYVRSSVSLPPLIVGGGQERSMRAGTEALPAIAGFGEAALLAAAGRDEALAHVRSLYERTVSLIRDRLPEAVILSPGDSPYILCLSLPGYKSEVLLNCLDSDGVYVSKGSACKRGARSHVLEAMGLPPEVIDGALRVSFSPFSTQEEAEYFVSRLSAAAMRARPARRRRA